MTKKKKISVIIPFYRGNKYIERTIKSIESAYYTVKDEVDIEVIIINDSPNENVALSSTFLECRIIENENNLGIHRSRINGLLAATGEYIQFLDQDDELMPNGYAKQLSLLSNADVVVGNGIYSLGQKCFTIYKSLSSMKYLIQLDRMIRIRNLIPSPGECLLRREAIPAEWIKYPLSVDGADDWMLWVVMFKQDACFELNPLNVYKHHDAGGNNLSADLNKMRLSATEANNTLKRLGVITAAESKKWQGAIDFKCLQDTKQLKTLDVFKYHKEITDNMIYKIILQLRDKR